MKKIYSSFMKIHISHAELADEGRGIDIKAILKKVKARGRIDYLLPFKSIKAVFITSM